MDEAMNMFKRRILSSRLGAVAFAVAVCADRDRPGRCDGVAPATVGCAKIRRLLRSTSQYDSCGDRYVCFDSRFTAERQPCRGEFATAGDFRAG